MQETAAHPFTPEQVRWLEGIRDHIAGSVRMEMTDFQYAPFNQPGGLGKAYEPFEDKLAEILEELNGAPVGQERPRNETSNGETRLWDRPAGPDPPRPFPARCRVHLAPARTRTASRAVPRALPGSPPAQQQEGDCANYHQRHHDGDDHPEPQHPAS